MSAVLAAALVFVATAATTDPLPTVNLTRGTGDLARRPGPVWGARAQTVLAAVDLLAESRHSCRGGEDCLSTGPDPRRTGAGPVPTPTASPTTTATTAASPDDGVDIVEKLGEPIPKELRFYDAFMNDVAVRDFLGKGKPVVLTLVYFECPMLCSLVLNGVIKGLNGSGLQLGQDYRAITVSFNPKETPREAAHHQQGYLQTLKGVDRSAAQDWPFLTGGEKEIRALADGVGFRYRYDAEAGQFAHPAAAFVLTPEGKISRYLYGIEFPPRDLRLALVEAADGKVGTSFDRFLLKCFKYDPATRKYRLYVWNFVRAGSLAVFVALATALVIFWRREVKRGGVA